MCCDGDVVINTLLLQLENGRSTQLHIHVFDAQGRQFPASIVRLMQLTTITDVPMQNVLTIG
jgi:hypothetical protein